MPIEVGIWRLGKKIERVEFSSIRSERRLEDVLTRDISILSPDLMMIGRQVPTVHGKSIDILAMDGEGNLTVIELKRARTPRKVVAQLLDYASWVQTLSYGEIAAIYLDRNNQKQFEEGFAEAFGTNAPEKLNESHKLVLVATELDPASERIINYLSSNYDVPINAVFFRYFKDGDHEYLTRTWLIDPAEAGARSGRGAVEPWNGHDFYVTQEDDETHAWDDCRRYGFVAAGGGKRFISPFRNLFQGARVSALIPHTGYVGVGIVEEEIQPVTEFVVKVDGRETPILEAQLKAKNMEHDLDDPDRCEHLVRVDWLKTLPTEEAYWEKGMFANQNTACRLRNRFTLERLKQHFNLDD